MKTLCVIPCGSSKIWSKKPDAGPTKAKYAYKGSFHSKCREYAQKYHSDWCILSAKYGYLFPDDIIPGNYNVTFNKKQTGPISIMNLREQAIAKGLNKYDRVVVLAGKNYVQYIESSLIDKEFIYPLKGCKGMGYMMQIIDQAIKKNEILV